MATPRLVVLESPYAGDTEANVAYALRCVKHALSVGESPMAGHLVFPRVLDDGDPAQRAQGIAAHVAWIAKADALVVYRDRGVSAGMGGAIFEARFLGVPVIHRWLELGAEINEYELRGLLTEEIDGAVAHHDLKAKSVGA